MSTVNHPQHYGGDTPYEVIKVLRAWLTVEEFIGFCKGNAIKYQARHRMKGGLEDLEKAVWYDMEIVRYCRDFNLDPKTYATYDPSTHMVTEIPPVSVEELQPDQSPIPEAGVRADTKEEPIPTGVYFNVVEDGFYDMTTFANMGSVFYRRWFSRAGEFPQSRPEAVKADTTDEKG